MISLNHQDTDNQMLLCLREDGPEMPMVWWRDPIGFPTCVQLSAHRKWNVFPRFRDRTLNGLSRRQKIPCWNFTVAGVSGAVSRNIAHGSHSLSRYCNSRVRAIAAAGARVLCSSLELWILRLSHRFSSSVWATETSGRKSTQILKRLLFLKQVNVSWIFCVFVG